MSFNQLRIDFSSQSIYERIRRPQSGPRKAIAEHLYHVIRYWSYS